MPQLCTAASLVLGKSGLSGPALKPAHLQSPCLDYIQFLKGLIDRLGTAANCLT